MAVTNAGSMGKAEDRSRGQATKVWGGHCKGIPIGFDRCLVLGVKPKE